MLGMYTKPGGKSKRLPLGYVRPVVISYLCAAQLVPFTVQLSCLFAWSHFNTDRLFDCNRNSVLGHV